MQQEGVILDSYCLTPVECTMGGVPTSFAKAYLKDAFGVALGRFPPGKCLNEAVGGRPHAIGETIPKWSFWHPLRRWQGSPGKPQDTKLTEDISRVKYGAMATTLLNFRIDSTVSIKTRS